MPLRIQGRSRARVALLACLIAGLAAGCGTHPVIDRATLPEVFSDPVRFPHFSSTMERSMIEARLRRSKCGLGNSGASGLAFGGLSTRPDMAGGIVLDTGSTADGTTWFIHRDADDRDATFCGVALAGVDGAIRVSVTGVRHADLDEIKRALESGDFFCTCQKLTR